MYSIVVLYIVPSDPIQAITQPFESWDEETAAAGLDFFRQAAAVALSIRTSGTHTVWCVTAPAHIVM